MQIEDLKSYFDHPDDMEDGDTQTDEFDASELILFPKSSPRSREELLSHLPERKVADRIITRYFASMSPSQRKCLLSTRGFQSQF